MDSTVTPCDGSIVVCELKGEFVLRRLWLRSERFLERLENPVVHGPVPDTEGNGEDNVFGVVTCIINNTWDSEFDDCPVI